MNILEVPYENYDHVLLDASSLMYDIPAELLAWLEDHPLLAAPTYESECNCYRMLLPDHWKSFFDDNHSRLSGAVQIGAVFRPERYQRKSLNQDTLGLLRLLCASSTRHLKQQRSCLLVTADLSQLHSLVAYHVQVDVLFLQDGMFYNQRNSEALEARVRYREPKSVSMTAFHHQEQATAYLRDGSAIQLTQVHDRLGSSCIYSTMDDRCYAKIFHEERQTSDKIEHIKRLINFNKELHQAHRAPEWLLLPMEMLYMDPDGQHPVGYLMPRAGNPCELEKMLNNLDRPDDTDALWETFSRIGYCEYLKMAWLIACHVAYLKIYNLWPSDYNLCNFALFYPSALPREARLYGDWQLYMWDTDSFCWKGYMSNRWCPNLQPPPGEIYSEDKNYSEDTIVYRTYGELCSNALFQRAFSILSLREYPYGAERSDPPVFCFDENRPENRFQFFYIPYKLRLLFRDVFVGGFPASVPCLLHELALACRESEASLITLGELDQKALELARSGAAFCANPTAGKLTFPKYPIAPEASAPLSVWTRRTAAFTAKRSRPNRTPPTRSTEENEAGWDPPDQTPDPAEEGVN